MDRKRLSENGFILADIVLGMFIFVVALLSIGGLYLQSTKATSVTNNRTVAYNLAQAKIEELKSTSANWTGSSIQNTDPISPKNDEPRTGFKRTVDIECPATITITFPGSTTVNSDTLRTAVSNRFVDTKVTVTWTEKGVAQSVSLETLIVRQP